MPHNIIIIFCLILSFFIGITLYCKNQKETILGYFGAFIMSSSICLILYALIISSTVQTSFSEHFWFILATSMELGIAFGCVGVAGFATGMICHLGFKSIFDNRGINNDIN